MLSSAAVAAIEDLELAARLIVEGARSGEHRSPFHGFAAEFSQHRPYRPGDDLKYLDWKVLARTDRLYSRQFSETTNLSVMLVLDASGSMAFPDAPAVSKMRYAVLIAAAIAYLVVERGDAAGLVVTGERPRTAYLPARGGRTHLQRLLAQLARVEAHGTSNLDRAVVLGAERLARRGLVLVVSDFYDATDETFRELRRVARRGHDVGLVQVVSRPEITFPYSSDVEFEDLESGGLRRVDADAAGPAYRAAIGAFLTDCRDRAHRDGHDYVLMPADVSPDRALRSYLLRRAASTAGTRLVRR
jgi:uncharacterized protein (DUF58 family)